MKKLLNTAFIYALAAMAGGVFYREFTKFNGFSGRTALGLVHTHLFLLGTVFFLLAALFSKELDWARERNFRLFYGLYNTGLCVTAVMLAVRGAALEVIVRAEGTRAMPYVLAALEKGDIQYRNAALRYIGDKADDAVYAAIAADAIGEIEGVGSMCQNMTEQITEQFTGKKGLRGVRAEVKDGEIIVDVYLMVRYGYVIPETARKVQDSVSAAVSGMTGYNVHAVNVHVGGISFN